MATSDDYAAFAARVRATGVLTDPWLDGAPRFNPRPVVLGADQTRAMYRASEAVAAAYDELCQLCAEDPATLDFFRLSPVQRLMWDSSAPLWHGLARADVFETDAGLRICELNCDTPSGEAEAVVLNAVVAEQHPTLADPNAALEERFCRLVAHMTEAGTGRTGPLSVGIIYPTELTEDLSMIQLYRSWFEARGWSVTLGSPFNLARQPGDRVGLFDRPCDVIVRHYKTDWWGERLPVWSDAEPYPDPSPLAEQLAILLGGAIEGRCAIVNPFGAVLPQNKRAMAFFWEHLARFSQPSQDAIRAFVPRSLRLEAADHARLRRERASWVLKSDYGCEGDEVVIGAQCSEDAWAAALGLAVPGHWIAQRYFEVASNPLGRTVNTGVYVIAGRAAGLFSRAQDGATDYNALSAPTLVET